MRGLNVHGYGQWREILDDASLGLKRPLRKELGIPEEYDGVTTDEGVTTDSNGRATPAAQASDTGVAPSDTARRNCDEVVAPTSVAPPSVSTSELGGATAIEVAGAKVGLSGPQRVEAEAGTQAGPSPRVDGGSGAHPLDPDVSTPLMSSAAAAAGYRVREDAWLVSRVARLSDALEAEFGPHALSAANAQRNGDDLQRKEQKHQGPPLSVRSRGKVDHTPRQVPPPPRAGPPPPAGSGVLWSPPPSSRQAPLVQLQVPPGTSSRGAAAAVPGILPEVVHTKGVAGNETKQGIEAIRIYNSMCRQLLSIKNIAVQVSVARQ